MEDTRNMFDETVLPESCDVKDALILKLEELDTKIYHLMRSN